MKVRTPAADAPIAQESAECYVDKLRIEGAVLNHVGQALDHDGLWGDGVGGHDLWSCQTNAGCKCLITG